MQEALAVYWDQAADFMWRLQFIQNRDTVSQEEREQFEWPLIAAYRNDPVGRLWWESVKPNMSPGNVRYVEALRAPNLRRAFVLGSSITELTNSLQQVRQVRLVVAIYPCR